MSRRGLFLFWTVVVASCFAIGVFGGRQSYTSTAAGDGRAFLEGTASSAVVDLSAAPGVRTVREFAHHVNSAAFLAGTFALFGAVALGNVAIAIGIGGPRRTRASLRSRAPPLL